MNNTHAQSRIREFQEQEVTMSLLQRTDVYQKADLWHPAFIPSGVMNSDVSEVTETDEDVLIPNARDAPRLVPDDVLERPAAAADRQVITDSEKWCGDQRTMYAVVKVEATSFVLAVICVALALVLVSIMFPNEWALIGP
jgi:hypothetical protein